jgi:hypothetical protein
LEIDEYFEKVGHLAKIAKEANLGVHELVENPGAHISLIAQLLTFPERILTSEDENGLSGYLAIGLFVGRTRRERLAAFAMTFEIEHEWKRREIKDCVSAMTVVNVFSKACPGSSTRSDVGRVGARIMN